MAETATDPATTAPAPEGGASPAAPPVRAGPPRRLGSGAGPVCPICARPLPIEGRGAGTWTCPSCRREFEAVPFTPPAPGGGLPPPGPAPGMAGGAVCGAHERTPAVGACGRCGIFLCAVCRIEAGEAILCPACFDRLASEEALAGARTSFRNYSGMASLIAVAGFILYFVWPVTGPAAVYLTMRAIRQRKTHPDVGSLGEILVALGLGILETVGGVFVVVGCVVFLTQLV